MKNELKLFINTATKDLSLGAIYQGQEKVLDLKDSKKTLEYTHLGIEKLLNEFSLRISDVTSFYLLLGPGSNTGIRLGLSIPRTIYALDPTIKLYGINTMKLLASEKDSCYSYLSDRSGNLFQGKKINGAFSFKRIDKEDIPSLKDDLDIYVEEDDDLALNELKSLKVNKVKAISLMIKYSSTFEDFSLREKDYLPIYAFII